MSGAGRSAYASVLALGCTVLVACSQSSEPDASIPLGYLYSSTDGQDQVYNQVAECIDLSGHHPSLTWNTSQSAGWTSAFAGVLTGVVFTAIVLRLQLRPSQTEHADRRESALAWLSSTLVAGIVATFMYSQVSGEGECTLRTALVPAAALPLMSLVAGLLVSLDWLLYDMDIHEARRAFRYLYVVTAMGVAVYLSLAATSFAAWPDYVSMDGTLFVAIFLTITAGLAIGSLSRKAKVVQNWLGEGNAHYTAVSLPIITGVGLVAFTLVGAVPIRTIAEHHGTGEAWGIGVAGFVLLLSTSLARPPSPNRKQSRGQTEAEATHEEASSTTSAPPKARPTSPAASNGHGSSSREPLVHVLHGPLGVTIDLSTATIVGEPGAAPVAVARASAPTQNTGPT